MAAESGGGEVAGLLIAAAALAALDWVAVATGRRTLEAVLKPVVPVLLVAAALLAPSSAERWWFAAALLLCLAGDVLLLPQVDRFVPGLAAFLAGHLAFVAGFRTVPAWPLALAAAAPVLVLVWAALAPPILRGAPRKLRPPIVAYVAVIALMAASAAVTLRPTAIAGAALFVASDSLLAWNRFVRPLPSGRLAVMVTYHLAIGLLTLSLVT